MIQAVDVCQVLQWAGYVRIIPKTGVTQAMCLECKRITPAKDPWVHDAECQLGQLHRQAVEDLPSAVH